jgi:beta-xylosidase
VPAGVSRFTVRVRNVDHHATFSLYDERGAKLGDRPYTVELSGMHHNTFGGFLSVRIALYAGGSGAAAFRRFRYQKLV